MGRFNWDWSAEGPPKEAYSRVTEPERFQPLHRWAIDLLAQLEADFEVERTEWDGPDAELERMTLARSMVKLTPTDDNCAPIIVAFTTFPGLAVRFGNWRVEYFPDCGCDACDEMPDDAFEALSELVETVVLGRFRESLYITSDGHGRGEYELRSVRHGSQGGTWVERDEAVAMLGGKSSLSISWMPWRWREN